MIKIRTKSTIYGGICPNIMSSCAVRIFIARVISKISARAVRARAVRSARAPRAQVRPYSETKKS